MQPQPAVCNHAGEQRLSCALKPSQLRAPKLCSCYRKVLLSCLLLLRLDRAKLTWRTRRACVHTHDTQQTAIRSPQSVHQTASCSLPLPTLAAALTGTTSHCSSQGALLGAEGEGGVVNFKPKSWALAAGPCLTPLCSNPLCSEFTP